MSTLLAYISTCRMMMEKSQSESTSKEQSARSSGLQIANHLNLLEGHAWQTRTTLNITRSWCSGEVCIVCMLLHVSQLEAVVPKDSLAHAVLALACLQRRA